MHVIIGCGYVGERVGDALQAAGEKVIAVTHSPDSAQRLAGIKPYPVHAADVSDLGSLRALAERLPSFPDTVLHCASSSRGGAEMYRKVYVEGSRHLLSVWPEAHLLFTSSSSVYPQTDGSIVTEESSAQPDRETSRLLREAEDATLASNGCVARLAGIYGPGRSFVLKSFLQGTAKIEGNNGMGRYLNQIHCTDAGSALTHLLLHRLTGLWNVVDDQPLSQRDCFTQLAAQFGLPLPPATPPDTGRKRAWTHKRLSNAKLKASGWQPHYPTYLEALANDPELVPSVLAQVTIPTDAVADRES